MTNRGFGPTALGVFMSRRWKAIGVLAVAAVVAAIAVAAAAAHSGASHASTLNIMGFGTNGDDVAMNRFHIAQKAIAPVQVSAPNGGFNEQQFLADLASKQVPDLVYWDRAFVGTYAAKGALMPLTSCIRSQHINLSQYRQAAIGPVTYKGVVYGIPEFFDVRTIIVDTKVADQSGVTGKMLNTKNLATLKQAALKMYKHNGSQVTRIGFDPKLPEFFPLWAKAFGVDILSKDGLHPHLNDPRAIAALTYANSLIQAQGGYNAFLAFRNTWDFFGSDNQVDKNQVGAWPMEEWYYNVLASASPNVSVAAIPFRNHIGGIINYSTGSAWSIPKGSKNYAAACKWMKAMTATKTWVTVANIRKAKYAQKHQFWTGLFTANAKADAIINKPTAGEPRQWSSIINTVEHAEKYSFALPASPASAQFNTAWTNAVNRVLQGQQSPKQALDQAQKEAVQAIKAAAKK
jgi:multiple sugar transport system substrate-binding protein